MTSHIFWVRLRLAPAPIKRRGWDADWIISTAFAIAFPSAIGRLTGYTGNGWIPVVVLAISSGNSKCTAPGRSSSATRMASLTREHTKSPSTICLVNCKKMAIRKFHHNKIILLLDGTFCKELVHYDYPLVILYTKTIISFHLCVFVVFEYRATYFSSLKAKPILSPNGMPHWVWHSTHQYRMFFAQTSTQPPSMLRKLSRHGRHCMELNQFLTKSHARLEDDSIIPI